jgi:hypothetical protein
MGWPQQATAPSGAFTTITSVPHVSHRCLVPTCGVSITDDDRTPTTR